MQSYDHKKIEKKWPQKKLSADRPKWAGFLRGKQKEYNHKVVERKWKKYWKENKIYLTKDKGEKKAYVLDMFPYPSGEGLHVGHPKGYIATDVYSRYKKMRGFNILHPMGWDAFGLPAENYAIKNKVHPSKSVAKNIKRYKEQLSILGLNYDWDREINTTDPKYYKWTQWIFLQMFKKGLTYQSHEPINWCPSCQTGLANEDLEDGKCERCGSLVEKKPVRQWVLKITDYAERLLKDLEQLDWPESIKESQKNWIGRSEGAEIGFRIHGVGVREEIKIFTTRPDTIFGATYLVLSPEHKIISDLTCLPARQGFKISNWKEVEEYIKNAKKKTEIERTTEGKEKTGVELKGIRALNPATGEEIPIWIADYVLAEYGTGAIMAVPAHDERDFQFAKKYNLPIKQVVAPFFIDRDNPPQEEKKWSPRKVIQAIVRHPTENKIIQLQWKKQPWKTFVMGGVEEGENYEEAARREAREETGYKNIKSIKQIGWQIESNFYAANKDVNRKAFVQVFEVLLENLEKNNLSEEENEIHEVVWVPTDEIYKSFEPVAEKDHILEYFQKDKKASTGEGIIINSNKFDGLSSQEAREKIIEFVGGQKKTTYKLRDWVFSRQRYWGEPIPLIHCEKCGVVAVPEKDLPVELPKVKNYEPSGTGDSPLANIKKWVNVKCPQCKSPARRETNTMPQWAGSCWYYIRFTDPKNKKAFADKNKEKYWSPVDVYVGGAEHATRHLIYARFWHKFLYDIKEVSQKEPFQNFRNVGLILAPDGKKMSKRYGNVINPDDIVKTWGADTLRVYEMFMGPFEQAISWSTDNMIGSRRFLEKIWRLQHKISDLRFKISDLETNSLMNQTIKKVTEDIESFNFNTAISSLMILTNRLDKEKEISKKHYETILKLLSPFAPHIAEELWQLLKNKKTIYLSNWPLYKKVTFKKTEKIAILINGKVREILEITGEKSEAEVKKMALESENVKKWLESREIKRTVYVKNKIFNIVI